MTASALIRRDPAQKPRPAKRDDDYIQPTSLEEERIHCARKYLPDTDTMLRDLVEEAQEAFDVDRAEVRFMTTAEQYTVASTQANRRMMDRTDAICRFTILQNDVLVIDDLAAKREFSDSPVVTEDGMQWYAGTPIMLEGHPVGTFCIEDREKEQNMTESDEELLRSYSRRAAVLLAFHYQSQQAGTGLDEAVEEAFSAASV